ncbi:MAG TPA: TlpA disulfide reductase family protein [Candidatus Acidoferrales bacterium]|nr:TlpA disulfide reductase family protein [Candidatus Acidoferrales bacterium]
MRTAIRFAAALGLLCCLAPVCALAASRAHQRHSQKTSATDSAGPEAALEKAFSVSGNDRSALVSNLQQYLLEFPNAPRKADVYRALVDACQHLRDDSCALNYAERLIAIQPDDSDMMLIAVTYLQRKGDDDSLASASDYVTRVIDRVEKSQPEERPSGESPDQWAARQQSLRGVLYFLRGQIRYARQDYDAAAKDLQASYEIHPSAGTAEMLGEIAELDGDRRKAIDEYTLAFVLPDPGPEGKIDRRDIRERLGNVWRALHGSDQGLGDEILDAYDRVSSIADAAPTGSSDQDEGNVFGATLRRLDGTPMALSTLKGNVIVVNFWATWCIPCTQINAQFDDLANAWSGEKRVAFLMADVDDRNADVPPFVKKQKWHSVVAYADGLDRLLKIKTLPATIVIAPNGRVVYRVEYPAARGFAGPVSSAIQQTLAATQ